MKKLLSLLSLSTFIFGGFYFNTVDAQIYPKSTTNTTGNIWTSCSTHTAPDEIVAILGDGANLGFAKDGSHHSQEYVAKLVVPTGLNTSFSSSFAWNNSDFEQSGRWITISRNPCPKSSDLGTPDAWQIGASGSGGKDFRFVSSRPTSAPTYTNNDNYDKLYPGDWYITVRPLEISRATGRCASCDLHLYAVSIPSVESASTVANPYTADDMSLCSPGSTIADLPFNSVVLKPNLSPDSSIVYKMKIPSSALTAGILYNPNNVPGPVDVAFSTQKPCAYNMNTVGYTNSLNGGLTLNTEIVSTTPTSPYNFTAKLQKGTTVYVSIKGKSGYISTRLPNGVSGIATFELFLQCTTDPCPTTGNTLVNTGGSTVSQSTRLTNLPFVGTPAILQGYTSGDSCTNEGQHPVNITTGNQVSAFICNGGVIKFDCAYGGFSPRHPGQVAQCDPTRLPAAVTSSTSRAAGVTENLGNNTSVSNAQAMAACPAGTQFIKELVKNPKASVNLFEPETTYKSLSPTTYAVFTATLPLATDLANYPKSFAIFGTSGANANWISTFNTAFANTKNEYAYDEFEYTFSTNQACVFTGPNVMKTYSMTAGGTLSVPIYPSDDFKTLNKSQYYLKAGTKYYITVRGKPDEPGKYKIRHRYDPISKTDVTYSDKGGTYGVPLTEDSSYLMGQGATFAAESETPATVTDPNRSVGPATVSAITISQSLSLYSRDENTGGQVSLLQTLLKSTVCPTLFVSGFFGVRTEECLKLYQTNNGIPALGFTGPLTRSSLAVAQKDTTLKAPAVVGGNTVINTDDSQKAAVVGGSITKDFCGNSDLPIKVIAGPGASSVITWGSSITSIVGPNVILPLRAYLDEPFVVQTNYQNSDVTIETNPSSLIASNGISIKRLSSTSFEITVKDGKFITKDQPEARLYIRASSSYTPKTKELYRDGCSFITISPNLSSNNTIKTPTIKLTDGSNLNWIGVQTLSVEGLVPGAKAPYLCVKGTGSKAKACEELDGVVGFIYPPSFYQEQNLVCSPYKEYSDSYGKSLYYCKISTPGFSNFSSMSSMLRNPYNIYIGKQDVNVSQYDNSKISYQKSNTIQLNVTAGDDSKTPAGYCPSGQVPYMVYSSGAQSPTCTSCDVIAEKERATFSQCNGIKDPDPKWETSAGSAPKTPGGVMDLGFGNMISQCGGNTAPGVVGQTCTTKGFKCYVNNSSSYTIYSCPGSTQVASYLEGKVYEENFTGALTPAPAGQQVARALLIPGWTCSEVVKTDSTGKYRFEGTGGCLVLPTISVFKSTEILNGTTAGQTVFSNPNSITSIRPTSYGAVPDLIVYNNQGYNYTFQNNKVVGSIDTSKCSYDSASQENMRLKRIFTERNSKAPQGTPGVYNGETYWYTSSELEGYAWIRPYQKCSDPVTQIVTPTVSSVDPNRKPMAYVYNFECSDIKKLSFSAFKYQNVVGYNIFSVGVPEAETAALLPKKPNLIYWSSYPLWTFGDGGTLSGSTNASAAADSISSAATKSKTEAYALCGL